MASATSTGTLTYTDMGGSTNILGLSATLAFTERSVADIIAVGAGSQVVSMGSIMVASVVYAHSIIGSNILRFNGEVAGRNLKQGGKCLYMDTDVTALTVAHTGDSQISITLLGE